MDHEWSSELLPEGAQGWDWVGLNLADGNALMAFRLRGQDGQPLWSAATFRPAGGSAQVLPSEAVAFEPLRYWTSPRTGIAYPVAWRVRIGTRLLHLQPLMDDQERDSRRSTGAVYWARHDRPTRVAATTTARALWSGRGSCPDLGWAGFVLGATPGFRSPLMPPSARCARSPGAQSARSAFCPVPQGT